MGQADTGKNQSGYRGAIIGFGNAAIHAHLPVWRKNERFSIDVVVETDPQRAAMAKELLPQARICSRMDDLFKGNGLDFVDICTPPCYHQDLILAACRSGLHVFCEKPLATTLEDLNEIHRASAHGERVVFTVNNWKYAPIWIKARDLVRENKIGTIRSVSLNVLRCPGSGGGASDWRRCLDIARGGILIDHGWHNLYVILSLIQDHPLSISARMQSGTGKGSGLEETVDLAMRFREAEATLHLTWQASCRRNHGIIVGDRGTISINDDHLVLETPDASPIRHDFGEPLSAGSHHPEWMEPVVENFEREIVDRACRGMNLAEARQCAQLIQLAYHSNREASASIQVCSPDDELGIHHEDSREYIRK